MARRRISTIQNCCKGFFAAIQELNDRDMLLAYHDRSDGGLVTTLAEMMFASRLGISLQLEGSDEEICGSSLAKSWVP